MFFAANYDDGYVVTITRVWDNGSVSAKPLLKFKEQGHAFIFRDHDCPKLTEIQIQMFVKKYNPKIKYNRVRYRLYVRI